MIRTSTHILKYQTSKKTSGLTQMFDMFEHDLKLCLDSIMENSFKIDKFGSFSSGCINHKVWNQIVYKAASEILRSQISKANSRRFKRYQKIYAKAKSSCRRKNFCSKKFSDLNLKSIWKSKFFTKPDMKNFSIILDQRIVDFKNGNSFDEFIKIKLPFFQETKKRAVTVCIPFKYHKHSLRFSDWNRKSSVMLLKKNGKFFLKLFYEKEEPFKKDTGISLGLDQGYKKLLAVSDGSVYGQELFNLYSRISNKKQGSKAFKKLLVCRNDLTKRAINQFFSEHHDLNELYIEDLKNVKTLSKLGHKVMNKVQRWSYRTIIDKLESFCEENGILLTKVNPAYTSQTCSFCGTVDKTSRNGEVYSCQHCGEILDADLNAARNILKLGIYGS